MLSYQSSTAEWDFFFGPNKLKAHNGLCGALILFLLTTRLMERLWYHSRQSKFHRTYYKGGLIVKSKT